MASEIDQQRLVLIEQRLGETERAQRRIDWPLWSLRGLSGGLFSLAMLGIMLAPFTEVDLAGSVGNYVMIAAFVVLYFFYVWRFRPELFKEGRKQLLFACSVLLCAAGTKVALAFPLGDLNFEWLVPLMLFGMIYAVVFDQRFAIDATLFTLMAIVVVALRANEFHAIPIIIKLVGSLTAVLFTYNLRSRYKLAIVGLSAGAVQSVMIVAMHFSGDWHHAGGLLDLVLWVAMSLARGMVLGVCATFLLPLLERVFNITTDLRLIELLEREHPLLQMMQERAPGTYQHTRNVANFTKRAVEAIGGNALLAEVAVMFHDLGKMVRPEYFTENEPESKLLHDRLSPMMSAMIIISHVSDGILIARKHKLPQSFEDFITGHHGTATVKYFYFKAKQQAKEGETILESQFRYPGPKPQSKEAAISALADHVEATARSKFAGGLQHPDDLRNMVRETTNNKLLDGQFDECNITRAELSKVEDSLVKSLAALYHHRVKYLEDPDAKRRAEAVAMREKYRQEQAQRKEKILTQ